jgi:hypothetical protein
MGLKAPGDGSIQVVLLYLRCRERKEKTREKKNAKFGFVFTLEMKNSWPDSAHNCLVVCQVARQRIFYLPLQI